MSDRPELNNSLDGKTFRNYYYLKEELIAFCRANGLPASGGKIELSDRIAAFLDTGEVLKPEKHRSFFKERIGRSFSFNVMFQNWLKANAGKTYGDAIAAYYEIAEDKKKKKTKIDKQFEYNTYVRDFFEDNNGRSLEDAIRCWKYKKSLPGHNRYENEDLVVLVDQP